MMAFAIAKNANRFQFIDTAKAFAIFLVVYYHLGSEVLDLPVEQASYGAYIEYFLRGFCTIGVPLFFVINGYLLLNRPLNFKTHIRKTSRLYFLTLTWSLITVLCLIGIEGDRYTAAEFLKTVFFLKLSVNNHLWFLFALTSIYLFFPVIKLAYDNSDKRIILYMTTLFFVFSFGNVFMNWALDVVSSILGHTIELADWGALKQHQPFDRQGINPFSAYFWAFVYFIIGGLLGRQSKNREIIPLWILFCVFFISATALFGFGLVVSLNSDGRWFDTVFQGYNSIPCLAMTISAFLICAQSKTLGKIGDSKIVLSIGVNTLGIYFLHVLIIRSLKLYFFSAGIPHFMIARVGFAILVLFLSWIMAISLKRIPGFKYLFRL